MIQVVVGTRPAVVLPIPHVTKVAIYKEQIDIFAKSGNK